MTSQTFVLKPILEVHLRQLYPNDIYKVFLHNDKATSYTAKITHEFFKCLQLRTGVDFINKEDIAVKAVDASSMDSFGFGYLKGRLRSRDANTTDGLWKVIQQ